jgi:sulfatase maturation enzyme AslB (radical SAM superfamily)
MESQMGILETAEKMLAGNHGALTTVANEARFALGLVARRPFQCLVQVTNRCNMKCSFCDFWPNGVPRSQELTVADYQRIADQMAELGSFLVSIEGGEPLVRPDIVDIVKVFAKRHLPVLYTNGWFVDRQFAHNVFAAGITQVGVSIDFPDATRHDTKRGLLGAHQRAWSAVEHFRSAAPHGGKAVHVMTVVMRDNQNDMEALLRQSRDAGVGRGYLACSGGISTRNQRSGANSRCVRASCRAMEIVSALSILSRLPRWIRAVFGWHHQAALPCWQTRLQPRSHWQRCNLH